MSSRRSTENSQRVRHPSSTRTTRIRRAHPVTVETAITSAPFEDIGKSDITRDENQNLTIAMDADPNDSSQASSCEPLSEISSQAMRQGSPDDTTTADESIGIDYRGGPSEVVVHGKNVSKILVKFPPQPPPFEDGSARSARRKHRSSLERNNRQQQKKRAEDESIPLSKEESLPYAQPDSNRSQPVTSLTSYPVLPDVAGIDSNMYTVQSNGSSIGSSLFNSLGEMSHPSQGITLIPLSSTTDIDVEKRMKDGILVGLEYFEKRNKELREIKNKLIHELDRIMKVNKEMEGKIENISKRLTYANSENDELKGKLDQIEKENARLQDQALSEWTSRVKTEEMYSELNASSKEEIKTLHGHVVTRDSEIKALKLKVDTLMQNSSMDSKDMLIELQTKMDSLREEVRRLTMENDVFKDQNNKITADLDNAKRQVTDKKAELDRQFDRFLTLKKSFNDIMEENERLKQTIKPQRVRGNNAANVTWPRDGDQTGSDVMDGETVTKRLNLPPTVGPKTIRTSPVAIVPKTTKTAFGTHGSRHRRQGSDARSENLPPVSKKDGRRS